MLAGERGDGKTALLAAWTRDWAKDNPDDGLFQHYFGATPESASPHGFLRRLIGELKARFSITGNISADPDNLRDALPAWLAMRQARTGAGPQPKSTVWTTPKHTSKEQSFTGMP